MAFVPGRGSPITRAHGTPSSTGHSRCTRGSRRARQRACIDSAPPMTTTSHAPAAISAAISFTRSWGLFPPTVLTIVRRGSTPSSADTRAPGSA